MDRTRSRDLDPLSEHVIFACPSTVDACVCAFVCVCVRGRECVFVSRSRFRYPESLDVAKTLDPCLI